jgi:hypothetical protein
MPISSEIPVYDLGEVVPLGNATWIEGAGPFVNEAGEPTNPTAAILTVQPPPESGANPVNYYWPSGTPALEQQTGNVPGSDPPEPVGAGRFYQNVTATFAGMWEYRLRGTGNVEQIDYGRFLVRPSRIPL